MSEEEEEEEGEEEGAEQQGRKDITSVLKRG